MVEKISFFLIKCTFSIFISLALSDVFLLLLQITIFVHRCVYQLTKRSKEGLVSPVLILRLFTSYFKRAFCILYIDIKYTNNTMVNCGEEI